MNPELYKFALTAPQKYLVPENERLAYLSEHLDMAYIRKHTQQFEFLLRQHVHRIEHPNYDDFCSLLKIKPDMYSGKFSIYQKNYHLCGENIQHIMNKMQPEDLFRAYFSDMQECPLKEQLRLYYQRDNAQGEYDALVLDIILSGSALQYEREIANIYKRQPELFTPEVRLQINEHMLCDYDGGKHTSQLLKFIDADVMLGIYRLNRNLRHRIVVMNSLEITQKITEEDLLDLLQADKITPFLDFYLKNTQPQELSCDTLHKIREKALNNRPFIDSILEKRQLEELVDKAQNAKIHKI